jgi:CheY-like chemotaxis protein
MDKPTQHRRYFFLVAEDDPNDCLLIERALKKSGVNGGYRFVHNGEEAVRYLSGIGEYADRDRHPFPTFLITDLKMPLMGGLELLRWTKSHPECAVIPIIVFSSSSHPGDVKAAYQAGANSYFRKPSSFDELQSLLALAITYWDHCVVPVVPSDCAPSS